MKEIFSQLEAKSTKLSTHPLSLKLRLIPHLLGEIFFHPTKNSLITYQSEKNKFEIKRA